MSASTDRARQVGADRLRAALPPSARRRLLGARLRARQTTSRARVLPDFMLIGGQRCGTSSLFKWLSRHPDVVPSLRKEIDYFSLDHQRGDDWYRAHFPLSTRRSLAQRRGRPSLSFEATPTYLFDPRAPARAHQLVPDAKLIVVLRDPAERAVSHYHHNVRHGLESLSLMDALAAEESRLAPEWARIGHDPDHRAIALRRFSYVARGRYAEQLTRWRGHYLVEQFLVLRSDELFGTPVAAFDRICDFLGVARWQPPEFRNYSYVDALDGSYQPPPADVARVLADALAAPGAALHELLGDPFTWP